MAAAFLTALHLDLYVRDFVSISAILAICGYEPPAYHSRPPLARFCPAAFYFVQGECVQPTSACCVSPGDCAPFPPTQSQGKRFRALPLHSTSRNIS